MDQFSKKVRTVRQRAWHPRGSRPRVAVSGSRHKVTVLGAVPDEGESLFVRSEEMLTADHGVAFLRAVREAFGPKVVVLLDRAPYFYAKKVWRYVSGEGRTGSVGGSSVERVVGEGMEVWYFPAHSPELNPVEGCWGQLKAWFNHRLVSSLEALRGLLGEALDAVNPPDIRQHICP